MMKKSTVCVLHFFLILFIKSLITYLIIKNQFMNLNKTHHIFNSSISDEQILNSLRHKNFSFDENEQTNDI